MSNVETLPDAAITSNELLARYKEEIKCYDKEAGGWDERARKIVRRYKDERTPRQEKSARYNVLYSNVQTLLPAIYGKNPKADIERRFKDKDPLGRVTSNVLERCTDYFINTEAFRSSLRGALFDRLTAGRGSVWSRYVPHFRDAEMEGDKEEKDLGPEISNNVNEMENEDEPLEEVYNEEAATDYVHWSDIGHNWARIWDEIYLIWRKVFLDKEELIKRFGEDIAKLIPLDYVPKGMSDQKKETTIKKAVIYECWDKTDKMVRWLHKDVAQWLDEKPDPLKLPDFFPCPKPLYSILANDTMIPVPDYAEYQDQACELDDITSRIASITKCLKVAGVYDSSAPGVERLLAEGVENKMIPVEQWAVHAEKGGLKGVMDFLPLETIAKALLTLYEAREKVKQDLYEITGIADIIRGQGDPDETATGVNTKGKFATLRLSDSQQEMARFARDAVKNAAIIIATHFSMDTIKKISGVNLLESKAEKDMLKQHIQASQQPAPQPPAPAMPGQPMPQGVAGAPGSIPAPAAPQKPPEIPSDIQELLDNPTWEDVERLLRDEPMLCFKIDIEIDSTIKMDEEAEKKAAVELLDSTGKFLALMKEAPPQAMPFLVHLLMFGVRRFRVGKEIESQFQVFADKVEKMSTAAGIAPPPDPSIAKANMEMQMKEKQIAMESEAQAANDQRDAAREDRRLMMEDQFKREQMNQEFALKEKERQLDTETDMKKHVMTTEAQAKPIVQLDTDGALNQTAQKIGEMANNMAATHAAHTKSMADSSNAMAQAMQMLGKHLESMHQHASKPKTVQMQGRDGRVLTATVQ